MSAIDGFLSSLRKQDVRLWLEGERLRFSAPPGVMTPELQGQMKARKEEIIAFLQQAGQSLRSAAEIIPTGPREGDLPLSSGQQRLWFLEQLQGPSGAYNMPAALRLDGTLDPGALQRSLDEIVRRHEVLRTSYGQVQGRPVQRILPATPVSMPQVDLQRLPPSERQEEVRRRAAEEARKPFDLTRDMPLRLCLLRLGEREHVLLLTLHHIASDGWSIGVLIRELAEFYRAFTSDKAPSLPELSIQYADFARWQHQLAASGALQPQLTYWREHLAGAPSLLELPTDRPRPAAQRFHGATRRFTVPAELTARLKQLSREAESTLFMTLLATFGVLLSRYSRQKDVVIGAPIANRLPQTEPLMGLFVNTLPLRLSLESSPSFSELLSQVRRTTLAGYAHQALPFEQLVEVLQPTRDLSHHPLFQVLFTLQNTPSERLALPGLTVELLEIESGTSQFDLSLSMAETPQGLVSELNFDSDLFDDATIERMTGHFLSLLSAAVADPSQPASRMPLLTEGERTRLLREWNATTREVTPPHSLHGLFEAQVARRPEAVAARFETRALTYGELDERANRLAQHLRGLGVQPGQRVGIFLERSLELLVGLLGILKAGAAYVPLDPLYPAERLAHILEDSGVTVLLTEPELAPQAPSHKARTVLLADAADAPSSALQLPIASEHLAYVLYTSGSTGKPKGVAVPHGAVVNFMHSMRRQPGMTEQDTLFAVTTIAFDISVLELFLPLSVGACVVIASRETAVDGTRLLPALAASRATVMQATPSTWRMMLALGWTGNPALKMLCGGEALPTDLLAPLRTRGSALWNMYGPTETTIWSTLSRVEEKGRLTIGRPIDNTQVYVLDESLQPVPLGVVGSLYIGGQGVAQGYLNRPELTAERFVPDPFGTVPGARLYCTGDLVRALPDGTLEFLGRGDGQIKLRGHRIELGEIEARLAQHPGVQEVAVRLWDVAGSPELVAYFRPGSGAAPDAQALREHLRPHLPAYMIPTHFVSLETFPRTNNGKLNRQALPPPTASQRAAADFQAPRTPLEIRLAEIWREVLAVAQVGLSDNFFDLGGHSMKAVQVLARVQEEWRVDVSLRVLFEQPTLGAMAKHLEAQQPGKAAASPPPLVALPRQARRVQATSRAELNLPEPSKKQD
ncbi:amino acid adenylation domain-containing protein [Hyalangium rubrum]|uniref:Amino acid adenylation domain-containing protein n=1 Tax=Hyalangium rubrum TaxID=3103134 RepID=A0ABU5H9H5_9BACT|nr:amino acid adenylation domain-containing protein [Hyalangium sp. s54d21]MDY7229484.1 amino acid adenylation domain-containing protein [Hyalangium sp. s54d21]